ncbi:MAG: AIR synthase-related protein, partial [Acidimicrobiales bacterium]
GQAARAAGASAMIDVSDGLAIDLHRMADASGVGFRLDTVPVAPGATREEALGGGEDYELVVATADPDALAGAFAAAGLRAPVVFGRCTGDPADRLLGGEPLGRLGWEHPMG